MNRVTATTIRQIEFELEKAEHGMAMPYDAERVMQLRKMLVEARKRKLSAGLANRLRRRPDRRDPTCRPLRAIGLMIPTQFQSMHTHRLHSADCGRAAVHVRLSECTGSVQVRLTAAESGSRLAECGASSSESRPFGRIKSVPGVSPNRLA